MHRISARRLGAAAVAGGAAGTLLFLLDLTRAGVLLGSFFDPTPAQLALLAIAWLPMAAGGAMAGAALRLLLPNRATEALGRLARSPALRRAGLALACLCLALSVGGLVRPRARPSPTGPPVAASHTARPQSVLWVVVDTLRADTLYGSHHTFPRAPALARLARNALVFTDAESGAGWTPPSVASMLSGLHPLRLDLAREDMPAEAWTMAERLRAAGYRTAAYVDNVILEPQKGFARGFDVYFQRCAIRFAFALRGLRLLPRSWRDRLRERLPVTEYGARRLTDRAVARLRSSDRQPLFLYVQYMDMHYPYAAHPELGPEPADVEPAHLPALQRGLLAGTGAPPTPAQLRYLRMRYARELPILDRSLARLLHAWDERFGPDSLVVVTADHGEEFLEHGNLGHGTNLHAELVHVPLVLRLPGNVVAEPARRGVVASPVGLVDLVPTVLDAVGLVPTGPRLDGASWLPLLGAGEAPSTRPLLAAQDRWGRRSLRWRRGDLVLVERATSEGVHVALYDVRRDPGERHDLSGQRLAELAVLRREASAARSRFRPLRGRAPTGRPGPGGVDALRALGYVD